MDFLDEVGEQAVGSRLKRLGDRMVTEAGAVYGAQGFAFEPRWFPLVALLQRHGPLGVVEASRRLGVTQPAVSQFAKQLERHGLVASRVDPGDGRRRVLSLSQRGRQVLSEMGPMLAAVDEAAIELCHEAGVDFVRGIRRFEAALRRESLADRVNRAMASTVRIVPYRPELKVAFSEINREWLEAMFAVESLDQETLDNPERHILDDGGQIWFAEHVELGVVGTCALKRTGPGEYELTKMGVRRAARGLKVGEKLLRRVVYEAFRLGACYLYLLTSTRCEAAIHLYLKNGFVHSDEVMRRFGRSYQRCSVAMLYRGVRCSGSGTGTGA